MNDPFALCVGLQHFSIYHIYLLQNHIKSEIFHHFLKILHSLFITLNTNECPHSNKNKQVPLPPYFAPSSKSLNVMVAVTFRHHLLTIAILSYNTLGGAGGGEEGTRNWGYSRKIIYKPLRSGNRIRTFVGIRSVSDPLL